MKLRVLGCSGGIGAHARTTSFLVDDDILLDAGTGVEDLDLDELVRIDHVFLTHCHLDHIAALPLLVDSAGALRDRPLTVHALPETIAALKAHIFNWVIWPDFTEIPHFDRPFLRFASVGVGSTTDVGGGRRVRVLPATHTVPAVGFQVSGQAGSLVFTGDTGPNDEFWRVVNAIPDLRGLIIETAFADREQALARLAQHLYPAQLGAELAKLRSRPDILITHLKPVDREAIAREIAERVQGFVPRVLRRGEVIEYDAIGQGRAASAGTGAAT